MLGSGIDVAPAIDVLGLLGNPPAPEAAVKAYAPAAGPSDKAAASR